MNTHATSRVAAIASLIVTVLFISVMALPVVAGAEPKEGHGNPHKTHGYDPDPDPSPSRSASRGGDCYSNPNHGGSGSNKSGAYDSSCDQGAGDNGNGGNGKCAGCTGKSDYKNPKGQYPGDHNNGYECDHNHGVGKGNPPHSQCRPKPGPSTPAPTPTPTPHPSTPCVGSNCGPNPPPCVGANCNPSPSPSPSVSGEIIHRCDANDTMPGIQECTNPPEVCDANESMPGTQVCGNRIEGRPPTRTLPFTGSGFALIGYLLAGLALLVIGGLLALARNKKTT